MRNRTTFPYSRGRDAFVVGYVLSVRASDFLTHVPQSRNVELT